MTSIRLRPALLLFSSAGVSTAASISARKLSNGTTRSIISNGSPFAEIAASRLSASKKPSCPIVPKSANREITNQIRMIRRKAPFFEVPSKEKRLARMLLLLANFGKEGKPEPIIAKITQETLAEMIGTTRARVSHFMNKFRQLGFIDYNGHLEVHSSLLSVVLNEQPNSVKQGTKMAAKRAA